MSFLAGMGFSAMSNPPTVISPLVGGMKPVIIRIVVDLPAPFGPEKSQHFTALHGERNPVHRAFGSE